MKKFILFTAALWSTIISFAQTQDESDAFPAYRELLTYFFARYTPADLGCMQHELRFAKKKQGWTYYINRWDHIKGWDETIREEELIWSAKEKRYVDELPPRYKPDENSESFLGGFDERFFDMYPYYGYEGWENDVIGLLGNKPVLADKQLDALARTYSSRAKIYIATSNYGAKKLAYDSEFDPSALSFSTIRNFQENIDSSISVFRRLYMQNPRYETYIGLSFDKYSNEYINTWIELNMLQLPERAKRYLPDSLYTPFALETAMNYFAYCEQGAIIFSNGDMDTYPLLYLQAAKGIRTDVTIINLSLSNLPRYVHYLTRVLPPAQRVRTTLSSEAYSNSTTDYIILDEKDSVFLQGRQVFSRILAFLPDKRPGQDLNGTGLMIRVDTIEFRRNNPGVKEELANSMQWEPARDFLYRSDLFLYDVLHTNAFRRPVYFTAGTSEYARLGLENYLRKEGLLLRVLPRSGNCNNEPCVNAPVLQSALSKYSYHKAAATPHFKIFNKVIHSYRMNYLKLAVAYLEMHDSVNAFASLDTVMKIFPESVSPFDSVAVSFADTYYQLRKEKEGDELMKQYTISVRKELERFMAMPAEKRKGIQSEIEEIVQSVYSMKSSLEKWNRKGDLYDEVNDLLSKYSSLSKQEHE